MKKISILLSAVALMTACNNSNDADKALTTDAASVGQNDGIAYTIDSSTHVLWTGFKATGEHSGDFKVSEGTLLINENMLSGGNFTIDMNSLNNTDMASDAENKAKLEGHLKSPDFFDVAQYPTAKFEITSVAPFVENNTDKSAKSSGATNIISGNLTLKDSTKNISFPATIVSDASGVTATADFNIDRTLWGMNYKGPNNPQDWFINKEVNLKLAISASKK